MTESDKADQQAQVEEWRERCGITGPLADNRADADLRAALEQVDAGCEWILMVAHDMRSTAPARHLLIEAVRTIRAALSAPSRPNAEGHEV